MQPLSDIFIDQHRLCDERFAEVENAASRGEWEQADVAWQRFRASMEEHFENEETVIFPEYEQRVGVTTGPVHMMRMEHQQMRTLFEVLDAAISGHHKEQVLGVADTLMLMVQQHNMKEEQILYPMIDDQIRQGDAVLEQIKALPA